MEGGGEAVNSRIVLEFPADGAYRVSVTSFRPGEIGGLPAAGRQFPPPTSRSTAPAAADPIAIGAAVNGRLAEGDGRLASRRIYRPL